jgi:glycerophosphoryl diester phosphodiesterase
MKDKIIVAHRGASAYEKGNTLKSFNKAIKMGADFLEFDIRKTKDEIFICSHDPKLGNNSIKNTTYDKLKKLGEKKGILIPKVKEIISTCKNVGFIIHLKEEDLAIEVVNFMEKLVDSKKIIIISEHMEALIKIRNKYPKIKLGYIILKENPLKFTLKFIKLRIFPKGLITNISNKNIDFVFPSYLFVGNKFLNVAKKAGIKVLPWTINNKKTLKKFLKKEGIYGIATDKLDLIEK